MKHSPSNFQPVFARLRALLEPYAEQLTLTHDDPHHYALDGPFSPEYKRVLFFGSVKTQKNYVSFYLMPVYMVPELLETISPELKKHMQGKSCFNFKSVDEALIAELGALTGRGFERFQADHLSA